MTQQKFSFQFSFPRIFTFTHHAEAVQTAVWLPIAVAYDPPVPEENPIFRASWTSLYRVNQYS